MSAKFVDAPSHEPLWQSAVDFANAQPAASFVIVVLASVFLAFHAARVLIR